MDTPHYETVIPAKRVYPLVLIASGGAIVLGLVLIAKAESPWNILIGAVIGGAFSFFASLLVQLFASHEQTQMVKAVTLDADGITPLPEALRQAKWIAYATKRPNGNGEKKTEWAVAGLTRIGGAGTRFVCYSLQVKNIVGQDVTYNCTLLGLQGCVLAAVYCEKEATSAIVFDVTVPDAGVFFGMAYLTDWAGDRDLTLAMLGTGQQPDIANLPPLILAGFKQWHSKIDWDADAAFSSLQSIAPK